MPATATAEPRLSSDKAFPTPSALGGLRQELLVSRTQSDRLFEILLPRFLYDRPIAERHRVIFYVGHLEAFDLLQICGERVGGSSRAPELDELFRAGIDPDAEHKPTDEASDWPSLERVISYVRQARSAVDAALSQASTDVINIAIEHRLMHLETLAYMFHNFPYDKKVPQPAVENPTGNAPVNDWVSVPSGEAILGKPRDGQFGWDNEYDEHVVAVPAFRMQRFKVTNGDYLRFVQDGAEIPAFWQQSGNNLLYRGMFQAIPLPLDWPVYVTQREAQAYAKWLGKDLPTEAQYHQAAFGTAGGETNAYPWGSAPPEADKGNFDFRRWDPESVTDTPAGESAFGIRQLVGNGWEWTGTKFEPFKGFSPAPTYPGYSANFFDGEHYVLKGGSPRTAARLLRRSFRDWFRADYPYVYAAFRCVEN